MILGFLRPPFKSRRLRTPSKATLFWINVAFGLHADRCRLRRRHRWWRGFIASLKLRWVTIALSASFVIGSLATQSGALLVREMRFGRQAVATISRRAGKLDVSVALALRGFRYWSLVWGQLGGGLTTTCLMFVLSPFRPGLPSRGTGLKEMLKFGANITAFDFVNYFHRNLDNILIGRFWGAEALGLYSRAYALLMFPITNLRGPINAVAFPAMSRLQNQPVAFRAYYLRVTSLLALLSMPLTAFLFVVQTNHRIAVGV